jgi:hypothetical protein
MLRLIFQIFGLDGFRAVACRSDKQRLGGDVDLDQSA